MVSLLIFRSIQPTVCRHFDSNFSNSLNRIHNLSHTYSSSCFLYLRHHHIVIAVRTRNSVASLYSSLSLSPQLCHTHTHTHMNTYTHIHTHEHAHTHTHSLFLQSCLLRLPFKYLWKSASLLHPLCPPLQSKVIIIFTWETC